MWWTILSIILGTSIVVMLYRGPVAALGWGSLVSLLFPCWLTQTVFGASIDLRIATSLILLLANLVHPRRRITWAFSAGDWALFVVYSIHVASDWYEDGMVLSHVVRAFGEWSVPYITGRLAVQTIADWRQLTSVAVMLSITFSAWAVTEAITHHNPGNAIFGHRPSDRTPEQQVRLGFKRAEGPTTHPIWFGMIQALLLPWMIAAAYRSIRMDGPSWWIAMPICSFCGIAASFSRGPLIGASLTIYLTAMFCLPKLRKPLIIVMLLAVVSLVFIKSDVRQVLESWDGNYRPRNVEIEGERQELTAMSYRWLVFAPYKLAISQVGLLGYGTARTSTFPVNVPFGPEAKLTVMTFWSIDCQYLLFLLRFGWLGLAGFCAVIITSIWHLSRQVRLVIHAERVLPMAIIAALASTAIILVVEWMPHDYGYLFLWLCGAANGPRLSAIAPLRAVSSQRKR
ncbi:O-antigen ligase family protein [Schlesneria paludicola]|uniref:O-antigen ligase family protein n=1 Tax=Schlesneria paludicola TaxID=360056 RepID=UPI00029A565F|nr:O-antigen ligase family protein [Schlesneria paludicola]